MSHITESDFQYSSARHLTEYIDRKVSYDLENSAGIEMSDEEKEMFMEKSEYRDFERHIVISPENDDMDGRDLGEATRDTVSEYFEGESVDFAYSVHRDTDSLHSHVALTGEKDDLYMNQSDLREFNELSEDICLEKERTLENDLERENDLDRDRSQGSAHDLDLDRNSDRAVSLEGSGDLGEELVDENDIDRGHGLDHGDHGNGGGLTR